MNMQIKGGIKWHTYCPHLRLQVEERWDSRSCDLSKDLLSSSRGGVKFLQIFWTSNKPLEMLGKGDSKETRTHGADGLGAEHTGQRCGRGLLSGWDPLSSLPLPSCEMLIPLPPPQGLAEFEPKKLFHPRDSPSCASYRPGPWVFHTARGAEDGLHPWPAACKGAAVPPLVPGRFGATDGAARLPGGSPRSRREDPCPGWAVQLPSPSSSLLLGQGQGEHGGDWEGCGRQRDRGEVLDSTRMGTEGAWHQGGEKEAPTHSPLQPTWTPAPKF